MEKRTYGQEFGFATRAVHTGNDVDGDDIIADPDQALQKTGLR
jgi:hypothetical protein